MSRKGTFNIFDKYFLRNLAIFSKPKVEFVMRKYTQLISSLKPPHLGIIALIMTGQDATHLEELTGTLAIAKHISFESWIFSKIFQTPFREERDELTEEYLCNTRYIYALQRRTIENRKGTDRKKE